MSTTATNDVDESTAENRAEADAGTPAANGFIGRLRQRIKRLHLMIGAGVIVLGAGGYAAASLFGGAAESATPEVKTAIYYDLPEMVVNLSATERRAQYLKVKIALEVDDIHVQEALAPAMPRVLDTFQLYLRELRTSDLDGSAGIFRTKEELLRRINIELHPQKVRRVLFKEIIVQ